MRQESLITFHSDYFEGSSQYSKIRKSTKKDNWKEKGKKKLCL